MKKIAPGTLGVSAEDADTQNRENPFRNRLHAVEAGELYPPVALRQ
jgi:hypothetical protein